MKVLQKLWFCAAQEREIMDGHQRQREQSAKMIEDALFELMKEKDFARITISEIAKKADVGRRTFYRLYTGKEEVLHAWFDKLCREYKDSYPVLDWYDLNQIAKDYFEFWYSYREILLLMHQRGLSEIIYGEISRVSEDIVKTRMGCEREEGQEDMRFFAYYSVGGFILLLRHWIEGGMQERPEAYAQKVSTAILKYLCNDTYR